MSDPFLGQIMLAGFSFAPRGFAACSGELLSISQNPALFSLLGTTYGGNGQTTFGLPDLRGRTPLGFSNGYPLGSTGGTETVMLIANQLPQHTHNAQANTAAGTTRNPTNGVFGGSGAEKLYGPTSNVQVPLNATSVATAGGGQPHENMQPFSVLNFCIALSGIFPARN